jgi:hypothetical protein
MEEKIDLRTVHANATTFWSRSYNRTTVEAVIKAWEATDAAYDDECTCQATDAAYDDECTLDPSHSLNGLQPQAHEPEKPSDDQEEIVNKHVTTNVRINHRVNTKNYWTVTHAKEFVADIVKQWPLK